jgi:hypothetical protein
MGHLRLGRLPKTRRWNEVVDLLDNSPQDTSGIAAAVVIAADSRLKALAADQTLGYTFWLLTRISWASRQPDFHDTLARLGIQTDANTSVVAFISRLTDRVRAESAGDLSSGHFSELSSLSLRRTLSETVVQSAGTLFGMSTDSLQQALRIHSGKDQFGAVSRKFFADFFARTLSSLVDRELSHHVGRDNSFKTSSDSAAFIQALDLHARESSRIMETFAADWYSKHNWEARGEISRTEAQAFVAVALRKLRTEFKLGAVGK